MFQAASENLLVMEGGCSVFMAPPYLSVDIALRFHSLPDQFILEGQTRRRQGGRDHCLDYFILFCQETGSITALTQFLL